MKKLNKKTPTLTNAEKAQVRTMVQAAIDRVLGGDRFADDLCCITLEGEVEDDAVADAQADAMADYTEALMKRVGNAISAALNKN